VEDARMAVVYLQSAAAQGEPRALTALGQCHFNGEGIERNYVEAANCWRKAANLGYGLAQHYLSTCYDQGYGVAKDTNWARYYKELAAQQGIIEETKPEGKCSMM